MSTTDDLTAEVVKILKEKWESRAGRQVPKPDDLAFANHNVTLTGTVLYADLAESTDLVFKYKPSFVAEIYKCYLSCACRVIRKQGGAITAFDGDRVMAVFIDEQRNTSAARAALAINDAVVNIINPRLRLEYKLDTSFAVRQAIGIDTSDLLVARTGMRGANDLVWVGRAANIAAKLCAIREANYATWITGEVYDALAASVRTSSKGLSMWDERTWGDRKLRIHGSTWTWPLP